MGSKAKEKRIALGDKYIGKHGTNKIKGAARPKHNRKKLEKLNEKKHFGSTLTQARSRRRAEGVTVPEGKEQEAKPAIVQSSDTGDRVLEYLKQAGK